ncbi:sigma-E factor negative regulatory protein [Paraburkholderia hayleyella]|uniref:sigma-E factor negative regulatory protein n=1 Tax=Paraburkholderia hayleyella TaxID=2152889 RepID=UPI001290AC95|nr:RseA family anti-sigma factor [Paraburkholderia hayleyella]
MGSVSMQSQAQLQAGSRGERLSAFVDGELFGDAHLNTFFSDLDHADREAWSRYHLIGDVLRSDELAVSPAASSAFFSGFAARFEHEPHVVAPVARHRALNLGALRRRMVPAFAVAAAAATLTWIVVPQLQGQRGGTGGSQANTSYASVMPANVTSASMQHVALASAARITPAVAGDDSSNIIRDVQLDQYLEAHQQFAQQPVMAGSMPLIRTAAMTTQGQ